MSTATTLETLQQIRTDLTAEKTSQNWLMSAVISNRHTNPVNTIQEIAYALHWLAKENNVSDMTMLAKIASRLTEFNPE